MRAYMVLTSAAVLAGCTLGPDYRRPEIAVSTPGGKFARGDAAQVSSASPAVARWWEALGDPTLSQLEDRALGGNPQLGEAVARVRQARASFRQQRASGLPSVNVSAIYAHARIPGLDLEDGGGADVNVYNLGFDSSWELDLFGGRRRSLEAARATVEAAEARLVDSRVSLTAEVAAAYINLRDRQQRVRIDNARITRGERMAALVRQRFARGTANKADVETLSQTLERERAELGRLEAERDTYLNALAILIGGAPGTVDAALGAGENTAAPIPAPPTRILIGDPASLLLRRPDIRAAERTLAAQTAKIGQAKAARLPHLSFMGLIGIGGTTPSSLFDLDDLTTLAAPQLRWSALDFGSGAAKVRQAEGVRDEAEAAYRSSLLTALRDAEDALARLHGQRRSVEALSSIARSADNKTGVTQQRYRAGTASLVDQLSAERDGLMAQRELAAGQAELALDFVSVQKALGLGWDDKQTQAGATNGRSDQ